MISDEKNVDYFLIFVVSDLLTLLSTLLYKMVIFCLLNIMVQLHLRKSTVEQKKIHQLLPKH